MAHELEVSNLFSVKGKVALVTGGSSGIGLMIAQALVKNGAKVYISSRKAKICNEVAEQLTKMGPGTAISLPADLVNEANCKKLVAELEKREPKLHILFNNAGATWGDTFENYPEEAWQKLYSLNVVGLFSLTRACVPLLEKAGVSGDPSRVINVASVAGFTTSKFDNAPAYLSSKAAVIHLTRFLALQLADKNITTNCIAPGIFPSRMARYFTDNEGIKNAALSSIPLSRFGDQQDMGGMALFLSSRASAYMNGATVVIDGGQSASSKL